MRAGIRNTSPAMAVALVALFVSLGGVSYAVATGSVGTRAIKDGLALAGGGQRRPDKVARFDEEFPHRGAEDRENSLGSFRFCNA